jgi:hypothetical protein
MEADYERLYRNKFKIYYKFDFKLNTYNHD